MTRSRLPVPSLDYLDHSFIGFVTRFVSFELNISKVSFCKIIFLTNVRMTFVTTRHGHLTFTNTKPGFVFVNVND